MWGVFEAGGVEDEDKILLSMVPPHWGKVAIPCLRKRLAAVRDNHMLLIAAAAFQDECSKAGKVNLKTWIVCQMVCVVSILWQIISAALCCTCGTLYDYAGVGNNELEKQVVRAYKIHT